MCVWQQLQSCSVKKPKKATRHSQATQQHSHVAGTQAAPCVASHRHNATAATQGMGPQGKCCHTGKGQSHTQGKACQHKVAVCSHTHKAACQSLPKCRARAVTAMHAMPGIRRESRRFCPHVHCRHGHPPLVEPVPTPDHH